eukprot:7566322-Pyramimonas_sp.AAC.1
MQFKRSPLDLPAVLQPLVLALLPIVATCVQQVHDKCMSPLVLVEFFSGMGAIFHACDVLMGNSAGFDKSYHKHQDFLTERGIANAVLLLCRLVDGGFVWAAPQCSSWVFVARSGTSRTKRKAAGDPGVRRVRDGNKMVVNLAGVLALAWCMGHDIFIEQPSSSLMRHFEPFTTLITQVATAKCRTFLGAFGARTAKPIDIFSSSKEVCALKRKAPNNLPHLAITTSKGVNGKHKPLSSSQAYPCKFGAAVCALFKSIAQKRTSNLFFKTVFSSR